MVSREEYFNLLFFDYDEFLDERISKVDLYIANLKYHEPFKIATGTFSKSENLIVIMYDENGEYGVGEAPLRELTDALIHEVREETKLLVSDNSLRNIINTIINENYEAHLRLALSMAIIDLLTKKTGKRYGDFFSKSYPDFVDTDITIGIRGVEETIATMERFLKLGFKTFKIKVGEDIKKDTHRVSVLNEHAPSDVVFRFDANQGWSVEDTLEFISFLNKTDMHVEFIEQPLPKEHYQKINEIREKTEIPIILDESVRKSSDVEKVARYTDGVNLKPVKAESIFEIAYGYTLAKELSLLTMIGCSSESNIGITSSTYLSAAFKLDFSDLDSDILQEKLLKRDVTQTIGGKRILPNSNGLGITLDLIDMSKLNKI